MGHWVASNKPDVHGLRLNAGGTGRMEGANPALADGFLRWEVWGSTLRILFHGEEGEHGDYEEFHYTVNGGQLVFAPPILGETEFRVKPE